MTPDEKQWAAEDERIRFTVRQQLVPKPKQPYRAMILIAKIANSSFVLWLLSAVGIGIWYSNHKAASDSALAHQIEVLDVTSELRTRFRLLNALHIKHISTFREESDRIVHQKPMQRGDFGWFVWIDSHVVETDVPDSAARKYGFPVRDLFAALSKDLAGQEKALEEKATNSADRWEAIVLLSKTSREKWRVSPVDLENPKTSAQDYVDYYNEVRELLNLISDFLDHPDLGTSSPNNKRPLGSIGKVVKP